KVGGHRRAGVKLGSLFVLPVFLPHGFVKRRGDSQGMCAEAGRCNATSRKALSMWARNLFFVAIVVGGLFALRASLFPLSTEARKVKFDPGPTTEDDFRATVNKV